jgi:hypothetical protein
MVIAVTVVAGWLWVFGPPEKNSRRLARQLNSTNRANIFKPLVTKSSGFFKIRKNHF